MYLRTGPRWFGGIARSSPVCMAAYSRLRASRDALLFALPAVLRSVGTRGRLFAASASLRLGVGRPLPDTSVGLDSSPVEGVARAVTGFLSRPNTPPG